MSTSLPALSFGCFECFLGPGQDRVDFDISITGLLNEHAHFVDWFDDKGQGKKVAADPVLMRLLDLCRVWRDPEFALGPFLNEIWIAYDIKDPFADDVRPWYYFSFTTHHLGRDPEVKSGLVFRMLELLGEELPAAWMPGLKRFFERLHPSIFVSAIGIQSTRPGHALRAYLVFDGFGDLERFLAGQGWPGDLTALRNSIGGMSDHCQVIGLSVDLAPGLQHDIGIELWFEQEDARDRIDHLAALLMEKGLCTEAQRMALKGWEGRAEMPNPGGYWAFPEPYLKQRNGEPEVVTIRRMSRYVKLIVRQDSLQAKAYLYFDRLVYDR